MFRGKVGIAHAAISRGAQNGGKLLFCEHLCTPSSESNAPEDSSVIRKQMCLILQPSGLQRTRPRLPKVATVLVHVPVPVLVPACRPGNEQRETSRNQTRETATSTRTHIPPSTGTMEALNIPPGSSEVRGDPGTMSTAFRTGASRLRQHQEPGTLDSSESRLTTATKIGNCAACCAAVPPRLPGVWPPVGWMSLKHVVSGSSYLCGSSNI